VASDRKVFSEQEVSAVVRRAVELQEGAGKETYTPGVTPEELQKIAAELGIEPKYLQQAINEAVNSETKHGPLNLTEEFERVVDTELAPEDYDVLLKHLHSIGHRHPISQVGRTLTGRTWTGRSFATVEVTSKRGRTRVKVRSNPFFAFLVSIYPAFIATMMLLGPLASGGHIWLALGLIAAVFLLMGMCFKGLVNVGHNAAKKLADKLAESIVDAGQVSNLQNLANQAPAVVEEPQQLKAQG
jgi:hypothetical protein